MLLDVLQYLQVDPIPWTIPMPRGVEVSTDVRLIVIRMNALDVPTNLISYYTGIAPRTVQHIVHIYKTTGKYQSKPRPGKPRTLAPDDARVRVLPFLLLLLMYLSISLISFINYRKSNCPSYGRR